ncbi:MarR family transcriptional regulator, partial [Escherichia coli]|nr:MarR family transcriptional regulator [Escherichia coli]
VASFLRPYEITPEQWTVLKKVSESDRITQKQLAIKADKDQATLTKILDLLEKSGHLQRIRNPEDRRSYYIQQTEKGMALQEEIT